MSVIPKVLSTRHLPSSRLYEAARAAKVHLVEWAPTKPGTNEVDPSIPAPRQWILDNAPGSAALQVMMGDKIDLPVLEAAGTNLRVLATMSAGYDHIDLDAVRKVNQAHTQEGRPPLRLGYTPDVLSAAVADLTLTLALNVTRNINAATKNVEQGQWPNNLWFPLAWCGPTLAGKTIGFLGFGAIAQSIALKLQAFEVGKIIYTTSSSRPFDPTDRYFRHLVSPESSPGAIAPTGPRKLGSQAPRKPTPFPYEEIAVESVENVQALAAQSDVLFVLTNLTPQTKHIINKDVFQAMKPTSYVINSARGPVVHTQDLVDALRQGKIAGAGLDVIENEPSTSFHPTVLLPP